MRSIGIVLTIISLFFHFIGDVHAQTGASLFLSPASASYVVGSTFTLSLYLNTGGNNVNTVEADLIFPPNKLQVVSPTIGQSIFKIWLGTPAYSNTSGVINFRGGVPSPGINTSNGLITTITFRVKTTGYAAITFTDKSKVLLDDGRGSNALTSVSGANLNLVLPPPAGPTVSSPTHTDQNKWYSAKTVFFTWLSDPETRGYSYVLNKEAVDIPDDIIDSNSNRVSYKDLEDGTRFFHIKALGPGGWGGVSHYQVLIDGTPPANFSLDIQPEKRTAVRRPAIFFETTDGMSGIDHYEIKFIKVSNGDVITSEGTSEFKPNLTPFFIEAVSPYVTEPLEFGKYDIILRAYDKAGNFTEITSDLKIVHAALRLIGDRGFLIRGTFVLSWPIFLGLLAILGILAIYFSRVWLRKHEGIREKLSGGVMSLEHRAVDELKALLHLRKNYPTKS